MPPLPRRLLRVDRLSMAHPGDLSALAALLDAGELRADEVVAVIGKTEGNGGVNDFTRGYFTQSLAHLLAPRRDESIEDCLRRVPCVLSGGTEGVLSPHYVVFSRRVDEGEDFQTRDDGAASGGALAIGVALSAAVPAAHVGRWAQVRSVAAAVRAAMDDAGIARADDVAFVQLKCPCVTSARAQAAAEAGETVLTSHPGRSMAYARAAGAFGVAVALGEMADDPALADALLTDFSLGCARASVSSGVEVSCVEAIVLGHSDAWRGPLRMAAVPMADAIDLGAVVKALEGLGLAATPQLQATLRHRLAAAFVKCEPDRRGQVRGARHTMLDDTDIDAQRHVRGAVGGLVAGVLGDTRIFVSGGAEHQGPDGGGLVALIADVSTPCARGGA